MLIIPLRGYLLMVVLLLLLAGTATASVPAAGENKSGEYDPAIASMIASVNESELYVTSRDLQSFQTRVYGMNGNAAAASYLYDRASSMPELNVSFHGGELKNVIATLPGTGPDADAIVVVGAHYDSISSDPEHAPGATDNACGAAIVLELARIMSTRTFNHTVQFAFWNAEETDLSGSTAFVEDATANGTNILLYFNYDSAAYDPEGRFVYDVIASESAIRAATLMAHGNTLYSINSTLTENIHTCESDHIPFRKGGYPTITTHSESHGPAHTPGDTIEAVSFPYARKNAELGLTVLVPIAEVQPVETHP